MEEINKTLKFLVPAIPLEIAARNYTKFLKLRTNLFNVIGYNESEMHGPRTRPSFTTESRRFRVRIRKTQFVNPNADNRVFQDISGEWMLSEMKRFGEIAHTKRIDFIKAKLTKETLLGFWQPIPIIRVRSHPRIRSNNRSLRLTSGRGPHSSILTPNVH